MKLLTLNTANGLQEAITEIVADNGGMIFLDWIGEQILSSRVTIPRKDKIHIFGRSKEHTLIRAQSIVGNVFEFEEGTETIEGFSMHDFSLRQKFGNGRLISHTRSDISGTLGGRLSGAEFYNLNLVLNNVIGAANPPDTALYIEGDLGSKYKNISFGGGLDGCTYFKNGGSYVKIEDITQPQKGVGWNFMDISGSYPSIVNCYSAGGKGDYELKLSNSRGTYIQNYTSEGSTANNVVLIEDCQNVKMISGGVGSPDSEAITSYGMVIENSHDIEVDGFRLGARRDKGKSVIIDEKCTDIHLNCKVVKSNFQNGGFPYSAEILNKANIKTDISYVNISDGELTIKSGKFSANNLFKL